VNFTCVSLGVSLLLLILHSCNISQGKKCLLCIDLVFFLGSLQILKPAFTIILDRDKQCILLLIRGTHSIRDTLTAATGAVVPFHHTIVQEGGVSDLVLGYAHFGMVAAARWIAKLAAPCLAQALHTHPDYKIKVQRFALFLCSPTHCCNSAERRISTTI
jgi:hypothetical protein